MGLWIKEPLPIWSIAFAADGLLPSNPSAANCLSSANALYTERCLSVPLGVSTSTVPVVGRLVAFLLRARPPPPEALATL
jgi:hypothetical protein